LLTFESRALPHATEKVLRNGTQIASEPPEKKAIGSDLASKRCNRALTAALPRMHGTLLILGLSHQSS
jgi:hypothetical protein